MIQTRSAKIGLAPGSAVFLGEQKNSTTRIDVTEYNADTLMEHHNVAPDHCAQIIRPSSVTWIHVNAIHDVTLVEHLGLDLGLHPLTIEDIVNTEQRPKIEEFQDYIYVVLKAIAYDQTARQMEIDHISLIFGKNYVLSFQESESTVFHNVRERLRGGKGHIRAMNADYLAYALMDAVVDNYFLAVERMENHIEDIDEQILAAPHPDALTDMHHLRRDIVRLRKAIWPLREEIGMLNKTESDLIHHETKVFLRDLYDHTIQIIDMVETLRDILGNIRDTYLSSVSNRMNEIMKVLTIIATIFIPLTFIVGVYGMNFEYMPELRWRWGYFLILGIMIFIVFGMVGYFKKNKWL